MNPEWRWNPGLQRSSVTARRGCDFDAVAGFTVTIPAGAASGTGTFTLAPVDDAVDELDETVTVSGTAPGVTAPPSVAVTIADDDERGVTVTPEMLAVPPGASGGYALVLTSQPTAPVTIAVMSDTPGVTVEPAQLVFAPDRWDVAQDVTVAVVDDGSVAEGVVAQVTHTVAGGDYGESGVAVAPVPVTVAPGEGGVDGIAGASGGGRDGRSADGDGTRPWKAVQLQATESLCRSPTARRWRVAISTRLRAVRAGPERSP